jgi:AraC-like DNA-binding protein
MAESGAARIVTRWATLDARLSFRDWLLAFSDAYLRRHARTGAERAALLIRRAPARRWRVADLAAQVATSSRSLRHEFQSTYGTTVGAYVHLARIYTLLPELDSTSTKIYVVAEEAGYRSRKDFYRVTRRILQMTPGRYRRLSLECRRSIRRTLQARLFCRAEQSADC